jgi:uncharacterized protein (UPF0264 family)
MDYGIDRGLAVKMFGYNAKHVMAGYTVGTKDDSIEILDVYRLGVKDMVDTIILDGQL